MPNKLLEELEVSPIVTEKAGNSFGSFLVLGWAVSVSRIQVQSTGV